ncbi:MAG: hypothetical protein GXY49_14100 [Syntrophomonadaceae bacterium]|nr:hypothetical protein [Syntrophomonadaceae bacterium]
MKNKIRVRALAVLMALSLFTGMMGSASAIDVSPKASDYLTYYWASAYTGTNSSVIIYFDVDATGYMDLVGASYIVIQRNDSGVWKNVAAYLGSTSNGMLAANTYSHVGSFTYNGTSGKQYRALVTVYACDAYGSDSRTVTTNSITAQ